MVFSKYLDIRKMLSLFLPIITIFFVIYVAGETCTTTTYCNPFLPEGFVQPLADISDVIFKIFIITVVFAVFKILEGLVRGIYSSKIVSKARKEEAQKMKTIFSVIWWTLFIFIMLNILIEDFGQVVLSLGLVGFGLTFALQQPILNFVGWITIFFKGTYKEGDRIEVITENGEVRGDVIEIGMMTTTLEGLVGTSETKSYKNISFPNQLVLTSELRNYSWDSNYILDELEVSITYESNTELAKEIIEKAVTNTVRKNKNNYSKKRRQEKAEVTLSLKKLLRELHWQKDEERRKELEKEAEKLQKGVEKIEKEEKHMEELAEEFKPKMRIEMADSYIIVIAQYLTPYTMLKKNRTDMNMQILNKVKETKDVEIAYPHLQIVKKK